MSKSNALRSSDHAKAHDYSHQWQPWARWGDEAERLFRIARGHASPEQPGARARVQQLLRCEGVDWSFVDMIVATEGENAVLEQIHSALQGKQPGAQPSWCDDADPYSAGALAETMLATATNRNDSMCASARKDIVGLLRVRDWMTVQMLADGLGVGYVEDALHAALAVEGAVR